MDLNSMSSRLDTTDDRKVLEDTQESQRRLAEAYAPERFFKDGQDTVRAMARFLARSQACSGSVLNWRAPRENIRLAASMLESGGDPGTLVDEVLSRGQTIHDPRYMGHQVPPPLPLAALFEAVSSLSNQGMTVYEMGPWSSAVERVVIDKLGDQLGLQPGFGGVVTSGGSLANLTALLVARNKAHGDIWQKGSFGAGGAQPVILASAESHYSIQRAAGILGVGTDHCVPLAADPRGKVDPEQLERQLARLRDERRPVLAVVASACSTRCGLYDPIEDISAVCEKFGVWLHVDAAHGGAAAFSPRYAHYLRGVERADSIVWDAHKMLFIPALSTYLFYKRSTDQYRAANQTASYLFDSNSERVEAYNTGLGTIECTKRAASLSLWGCWSVFGTQVFTDLVEATYGTARIFADLMKARPEFQLLHEPESNILVFRYVPRKLDGAPARMLCEFQKAVRKRLIESGEAYIVPATSDGQDVLRIVIMNPLTTVSHFEALAASLARHGDALLSR